MNTRCDLCGEINCICGEEMTEEELDAMLGFVDLFYPCLEEDEEDDEND